MPNWICGTLKIRGMNENILRFFNEGLNAYGFSNGEEIVLPRDEWVEENHNDEYHYHEWNIKTWAYVDGTQRAFVTEQEIYFQEGEGDQIVTMDFRQAWSFTASELVKISKLFGIDIRVYGFEQGMQFCQEIEVIAGVIKLDRMIKYEEWDWECPMPRMGG